MWSELVLVRLARARRARDGIDKGMSAVMPALVRSLAQDVTHQMTAGRLLVLAPHPDDETLGCGATVAQTLRQTGNVLVLVATDGRLGRSDFDPDAMAATRRLELAAATKALGLIPEQVRSLGFPDGQLNSYQDDLTASLVALMRSWEPTTVLVTAMCDRNSDHAALGQAARQAMEGRTGALFEYIVWGWMQPTRWLGLETFRFLNTGGGAKLVSRAVTVRTEGMLAIKRAAMSCHLSQLGPSAPMVGLPSGVGPLTAQFLGKFFGSVEVFFPANAEALAFADAQAAGGRSVWNVIGGHLFALERAEYGRAGPGPTRHLAKRSHSLAAA